LERIIGSTSNSSRVLWNTSKSPKLFEANPFPQIAAERECLIHYVSLRSASALSVGFRSGALFAIKSHEEDNHKLTGFASSRDSDIWLHCPLRRQENEHVLELWSVSYRYSNLGTRALVVGSISIAKCMTEADVRSDSNPAQACVAWPLPLAWYP
jgi:hypothetical protein